MKLGPRQRKWLRDLPKYAKAEKQLYQEGEGFCCLGVYADTQVDTPWSAYFPDFLEDKDWRALGLRSGWGSFSHSIMVKDACYTNLIEVNDEGPFKTHAEMADFIREHADLIFTHSA